MPIYPRGPFADLDAAHRWVAHFADWYNREHRHSAIRFVTPAERHTGADVAILARRHTLYERARRRRPERWPRQTRNWTPIQEVVLNPQAANESQSTT
jgi:putative transposase